MQIEDLVYLFLKFFGRGSVSVEMWLQEVIHQL
jgi:hypothetical protein